MPEPPQLDPLNLGAVALLSLSRVAERLTPSSATLQRKLISCHLCLWSATILTGHNPVPVSYESSFCHWLDNNQCLSITHTYQCSVAHALWYVSKISRKIYLQMKASISENTSLIFSLLPCLSSHPRGCMDQSPGGSAHNPWSFQAPAEQIKAWHRFEITPLCVTCKPRELPHTSQEGCTSKSGSFGSPQWWQWHGEKTKAVGSEAWKQTSSG